ncbi:MAG: type I 3-dehydroquinate dehydratase, partial [Acidobacteria bacterium]|nr:type I 3-dehydroquinate dehydratase [Acidobacteriota bacterium]
MSATSNSHARVCVPVCVARAAELSDAVARAARDADIVELRLDCLADDAQLAAALPRLDSLLRDRPRPVLFTFRPAEQGGRRALARDARLDFWTTLSTFIRERALAPPDFVDLELDLLEDPAARELLRALLGASAVICSHHDFGGVPADLDAIYERMAATPARVLKIAVRASDATDCLPVFRLIDRARAAGREMIAVAMGAAGFATRVLAPARGAFLTYAAADDTSATAPGQPTAGELRGTYRLDSVTARTRITGLVGSPVAHSLSPHMHNAAFAARGLDAVYLPFDVRDFDAFWARMARPSPRREIEWDLRGLSVTAPHKGAVVARLDWTEQSAREIGAVNTVVFDGDSARGYNTDAGAALAPLAGRLEFGGARVAVIGAGGAARAVLWSLRREGARAAVFARDPESARSLA